MPGFVAAIAVYLLGIALLACEAFVPGALMGLVGFGLTVLGIYWGFAESAYLGGGMILATVVGGFFFLRWAIGRILHVKESTIEAGYMGTEEGLATLVGTRGVALSPLRPAGIIKIDHRRVDVVTTGSRIPEGAEVEVLRVEGNRVVVREVKSPEARTE